MTDLTFNRALLRLDAFSRVFAKLAACSVLKVGARTDVPSTRCLGTSSVMSRLASLSAKQQHCSQKETSI